MKKLLRLFSLILSIILCVSIMPACSASSQVALYDFETWKPDFSCIKGGQHFGVIRRNKDVEFCKSGNYSAKVMPIGGHINKYAIPPYFWFPTNSSAWGFDYQDFTKVDYVSCWVYNANDVEKNVTMGLVDNYVGFEKVDRLSGKNFVLKPNSWNELILPMNFDLMASTINYELLSSSNYTFTQESIKKIEGIYFSFLEAIYEEEEYAPVYYFDDLNIVYKKTENIIKPVSLYDKNSQTKTLLDFESDWHKDVLNIDIFNYVTDPLGKIVNDSDMQVKATSGKSMYELNFKLFKYTDQDDYLFEDPGLGSNGLPLRFWNSFGIPEYLVREFYKTYVYNSELENPYIIPKADWNKWYFTYDVYNASLVEYNLDIRFYTKGGKNNYIKETTGCTPNTWNTIRIPLSEIAASNEDRITDPGFIKLLWQTAPGAGIDGEQDLVANHNTPMKFYFDSFRLEQIENA